jgi:aspartyl-tRNA(Asn)/glutamyl-tRNA(Gln) amidotransferase subunit C
MSLDHATVRRIASLARIRVEDHEVGNLCHELNGILGWIEQLNEVDVSGVAPLAGATNLPPPGGAGNQTPPGGASSARMVSGVLGGAGNQTPSGGAGNQTMAMRADVVTDGGYPEKVLSNAPERIGDFYAVPKVVE